jgi:hypothetical protein
MGQSDTMHEAYLINIQCLRLRTGTQFGRAHLIGNTTSCSTSVLAISPSSATVPVTLSDGCAGARDW